MKNKFSKLIYFDNNATTVIDREVFNHMKPFLCDLYGNPSSTYNFGNQIAYEILKSREQVASLLNVSHENIIFTSCGTESNNTAINNALHKLPKRKKIITTCVEHPAIKNYMKFLKENKKYIIKEIPVDNYGRIIIEEFEKQIDENTAIVSIMWANNEIGNIYPIKKLSELTKKYGAIFHTDAVQAAGKINIDLQEINTIDMLSISGHKFHAPKGVGALYVKNIENFTPYIIGGHQEKGNRAGTENVASIIAIGKAAELAKKYIEYENKEVCLMRDYLEKSILEKIKDVRINGDIQNRTPNTLNVSFSSIEGESILIMLDQHGIAASSGSACTSGSLEPSHVLKSIKVPNKFINGTIRFSLSRFNTMEEIEKVIEKLTIITEKLRKLSPIKCKNK